MNRFVYTLTALIITVTAYANKSTETVKPPQEYYFNFTRTCLDISRGYNDSDKIAGCEQEISRMTEDLRVLLNGIKDPDTIINTLNTYIFETHNFKPAPADKAPTSKEVMLEEVVANKSGQCVGLSMLYLSLSNRLELPIFGVLVPEHFFVRYIDPKTGYQRNIDPLLGGQSLSNEYYIRSKNIPEDEVGKTYLKPLTHLESLGYMLHLRGYLKSQKEDHDGAMADHNQASQITHSKALSLNFEGDANVAKGDSIEKTEPEKADQLENLALEMYKEAIKLDQYFCPSYLNCAKILASQGNLPSAIYECSRALKVNPGYPLALVYRAKYYYDNNQYKQALADFQQLADQGPDSPFFEVATEYIRLLTPMAHD